MTITIRQAEIIDLPIVYSNELAYIIEIEPTEEVSWKNAIPKLLTQWISNLSRMFIIEENNQPIGHFFWQIAGESALLSSIYIIPTSRRKGYGRLLLERFKNDAFSKGFTHLKLGVYKTNSANMLYQKSGYKLVNTDNYYYYYEKYIVKE
jgi:ribosomal-protein-alanine N-acetyltransferase